jgi:hypothetical protein
MIAVFTVMVVMAGMITDVALSSRCRPLARLLVSGAAAATAMLKLPI